PCAPCGPCGPAGPCGPTVNTGSKVTLRSLFPETMVTGRVSGFQPELEINTVTICSPMLRLIDIGVVLPVLTPSIVTWAPEGNDVTFKVPLPDCARTPVEHTSSIARHNTYLFISVSPSARVYCSRIW